MSAISVLTQPTTPLVSMNRMADWLVEAQPGEHLTYYVGMLANALVKGDAELRGVAQLALKAEIDRRACLTQIRLAENKYAYRMTKRSAAK